MGATRARLAILGSQRLTKQMTDSQICGSSRVAN